MRKHDSKWKTLIPLIVAIVVMTGVFILISYLSYRQNEIEDLENYARGLTKLIAGEIKLHSLSSGDLSRYTALYLRIPVDDG